MVTSDVKNNIRQVDDSLLWESDIQKNFDSTCAYLTLTGKHGILQNPEKFQFCSLEVNWAGFVIGADSVKPMPHLTKAIREFPTPQNRTDLRSFMALVQQVSYTTAVAPLLLPFRKLLKDDTPWDWSSELQQTFQATREILADRIEEGIKMFDPYKITMLLTDWCKHGVGYLLAQKHCKCTIENDSPNINCCKSGWKVCMVGSRFTLAAEANYSPTEGELLGVANGLLKTKYFTLGCPHLYIGTDHKPLLGILDGSPMEKLDNPRLVRLKEKTLGWVFKAVYVPGRELGGTDALSRYGVRHSECNDLVAGLSSSSEQPISLRKHLVGLLAIEDSEQSGDMDDGVNAIGTNSGRITWEDVKKATESDQTCKLLRAWMTGADPGLTELSEEVKPFHRYKSELSIEDGVILFGNRMLIPNALRPLVLHTLHSSHQGSTSMLLRAERSMFWPGMSRDIQTTRAKCKTCDVHSPSQSNMPPIQPEVPTYPFQHICSDYFSLHGREYCVVVDRFSGWYNIYHAAGGTMNIIGIFTKLFQDMGVSESLTTDGGATYVSQSFQAFLTDYGVYHRVSSVGFPHGNTRSEIAVKSAKRLLRSNVNDGGNLNTVAITRALLEYRNTPDRDIGLSPAELLYGRNLNDFLPHKPDKLSRPCHELLSENWKSIAEWRENALARRGVKIKDKLNEHSKDLPPLSVGDSVLIQNQLGNHPKRWEKRGTVVEVLPHRQYRVRVDGSRRITLRNRQFLKQYKPLIVEDKPKPVVSKPMKETSRNPTDILESQLIPPVLIPQDEQCMLPKLVPEQDEVITDPAQRTHHLEQRPPPIPPPQPANCTQPHQLGTHAHADPHSPPVVHQPGPDPPTGVHGPPAQQLRRSTRPNLGQNQKYFDSYTGQEYETAMNNNISTAVMGIAAPEDWYQMQAKPPAADGEIVGANGHIFAMPLPSNYWDKSAWWTGQGWIWVQH